MSLLLIFLCQISSDFLFKFKYWHHNRSADNFKAALLTLAPFSMMHNADTNQEKNTSQGFHFYQQEKKILIYLKTKKANPPPKK